LIVLLIPTKETVYADLMRSTGRLKGNYARLVEMESRARNEVTSWCAAKQMKCIDALPDLRGALARRERVYPSSTESHPNAAGYGVLGATVKAALPN
jgi:2-oxo-4-hydroxy-4-carboxy--5-ureidoimidazoline (OHCU) decarboxylase